MPPSAQVGAEELTAAALEALSLADAVPFPTSPAHLPPSAPSTELETLPANIPLPPTTHPRATHAQHLLRVVTSHLHAALTNPNPHPPSIRSAVSCVTALALATPAYRRLLAHLGVVRLLAPAFANLSASSHPSAPAVAQCLAACLRGADDLAVAHFCASRATRHLLRGWAATSAPTPSLVASLCTILLATLPALPPTALDVLAANDALRLLRASVRNAVTHNQPHPAAACLAVLAAIVVHATDTINPSSTQGLDPNPIKRSAVQTRARETGLIDVALNAMKELPQEKRVQKAALKFLSAAVEGNTQNVVAVGTGQYGTALRIILRSAGIVDSRSVFTPSSTAESSEAEDRVELLCVLCDLVSDLSCVRKNFDAMLALGLTSALVEVLDTVATSLSHVKKALELLERAVLTTGAEGKQAQADLAASAVVTSMQSYRHNPRIQEGGIRVLVALMETFDRRRDSASEVFAVQAVHFAMTEHSRDAGVVAVSCAYLLQLSPIHVMRSNLVLADLKKVVRSRLKTHKNNQDAAPVIENLVTALELIPQRTVRSIQEFLVLGDPQRNSVFSGDGTAANKRQLLARSPLVTGSFRKSFHRRARLNRSEDEAHRRRRVRSDFGAETTFERNRSREAGGTAQDGPQSFRFRTSKTPATPSWVDSKIRWPSDQAENASSDKRPSDPRACETFIDTLARFRHDPAHQEEPSSESSTRSDGGRVPFSTRQRVQAEPRLPPMPKVLTERNSVMVVRSKRHIRGNGERDVPTIVEKRGTPNVYTRDGGGCVLVNGMEFDALESTSGRSEADVGEEDSLFSLSDSDLDSLNDETWGTDEGFSGNYPQKVKDNSVADESTGTIDLDTSHKFEGSTVATVAFGSAKAGSSRASDTEGSENVSVADAVVAPITFEGDEQFTENDSGSNDSTDSQKVVSMLSDAVCNGDKFAEDGAEVVLRAQKFGERERNGASLGLLKSGGWPLMPIDGANDAHRAGGVVRMHNRGESGSLCVRK